MTAPPPPPPPGPPPGWYPPQPPRPEKNTGLVIGVAAAGVVLYTAFNFVYGFVVIAIAADGSRTSTITVGIAAVLLALIAFGGGAALIAVRKPWAKGLGLGLMIGWALVTIVTVGFCTGVNPGLYTGFG